jgi:hypothetical protein
MLKFPDQPCDFALPLPTARLWWQLEVLGWSRHELARRLDIKAAKVSQWLDGSSFAPNRVGVWLEMLSQMIIANPVPLLWDDVRRTTTTTPTGISPDEYQANQDAMDAAFAAPKPKAA